MLAAFPPPAQATSRTSRVGSWFKNTASWPLPPSRGQMNQQTSVTDAPRAKKSSSSSSQQNKRRKFCGLPLWGFIVIIIVVLGIIAAAILVPLQFFVFRNLGGPFGDSALAQCREQLTCENGGTNVVARNVCSCICTNGFTGSNCTIAGSAGCTTTSLATLNQSPGIDNVTLGQAIPRLISDAQGNFSVPLSGTEILARFNSGSLSCTAQNSLVTFDGRSARNGGAQASVLGAAVDGDADDAAVVGAAAAVAVFVAVEVITIIPNPVNAASGSSIAGFQTIPVVTTISRTLINTLTNRIPGTTTTTVTTTLPPTATSMPMSTSFVVSEDVLDFARVAVLFILQEDGISDASRAQSVLQRFFTTSNSANGRGTTLTTDAASNVDLGNGNSIDLVNFRVNAGSGLTGGRTFKRALEPEDAVARPPIVPRRCLGLSMERP